MNFTMLSRGEDHWNNNNWFLLRAPERRMPKQNMQTYREDKVYLLWSCQIHLNLGGEIFRERRRT